MTQQRFHDVIEVSLVIAGLTFFNHKIFQTEEMMRGSVASQQWYSKEAILAKTCLDGAFIVLESDNGDLQHYLQRFTASSRATASSGAGGAGNRQATLESAPPTATISDIQCFADIELLPATMWDKVVVAKDIAECKKQIAKTFVPIRELIKQCKLRSANFVTRKQGWMDALAASDGSAAGAKLSVHKAHMFS